MKRILMSAAFAGMVAAGSYAGAQTAQSPPAADSGYSNSGSSNKPETMKECMARQKSTNSGMTAEAMHTTCKNEMKQQKLHQQGQDLATGPQDSSQTPSQQPHE
jgi:hypothetical protein